MTAENSIPSPEQILADLNDVLRVFRAGQRLEATGKYMVEHLASIPQRKTEADEYNRRVRKEADDYAAAKHVEGDKIKSENVAFGDAYLKTAQDRAAAAEVRLGELTHQIAEKKQQLAALEEKVRRVSAALQ